MDSNNPRPPPRRSGRGSSQGGGGGDATAAPARPTASAPSSDGAGRGPRRSNSSNKRKNRAVSSSNGGAPADQDKTDGHHHQPSFPHQSSSPHHQQHKNHHWSGHHLGGHHNNGRNPHRGGPGILWTCETGLERKCRHQATDILQHYYYEGGDSGSGGSLLQQSKSSSSDAEESSGRTRTKTTLTSPPTKLTLEQELDMLKKEGSHNRNSNNCRKIDSNFPFSVYETKCKGTVLMLCTAPTASLWNSTTLHGVDMDHPDHDNDGGDEEEDSCKPPGKRRCVTKDAADPVSSNDAATASQEDGAHQPAEASHTEDDVVLEPTWDPLDTVLAVIRDARDAMRLEVALAHGGDAGLPVSALRPTSVASAPSSRFVTRIIPLQITCYAAVDDIQAAFQVLLQRYLSTTKSVGTPTSESMSTPSAASLSSTSDSGSSTTANSTTTTTTKYMVQSKRRHCDNLRSKDVIDCVGALVPNTWKVDLRQPDIVVWVEICTNLAGLSIIPSSTLREAFQFNLLQARTASVAAE